MRIIAFIFLILLSSSCGLIKKSKTKHKFQDRSKIEFTIDSTSTRVDTSKTETTEKIQIVFKIGKDRIGGDLKQPDLKPVTQREALRDLIDRSDEVTVTVDKKTVQESGIFEDFKKKEVRGEKKDIKEIEDDKQKDSNTTFSANFPWYYILLIIVIVAIIIYIFAKKIKLGSLVGVLFSKKPP